jgi:TRAP-type uncharacterized transport system substrate-binding protein
MLKSRQALLGLLVSMTVILATGIRLPEAQTAPRSDPRSVPTSAANGEGEKTSRVNSWTLGIAAGLLEGDNLRILPIVTYGAVENIADLLYLKGVDVAITHADVFDLYKKSGEAKNVEQRVNYISQMHNTEFYVLARPEINSISDLAGKKVGFHAKGSGPSVTGPMIFERYGVNVEPVFINHTLAIEKMKTGEISAIFQLGAKPNDLLAKLKPEPGFHFIPLTWGQKFADYYLPATLAHNDYPDLIKPGETVDTLAVPVVLAVYNWPRNSDRARRIERFVHYYFERFDKLKQPSFHPKWKEVNLTARVPGWIRYPVADEVLAALAKEPAPQTPARVEAATGRADVSQPVSIDSPLFQEFLEWRQKNKRSQ